MVRHKPAMTRRRSAHHALLHSLSLALSRCGSVAVAQDYPTRPVKIVVPFPAGGGTDALTRFVARGPGAAARPAVHRREPRRRRHHARRDRRRPLGARRLHHHGRHRSTFAAAPGLYKQLAYDPAKDFSPIMLFATVPFVLVVNPSLGVNSVKELIALAKSKPGELELCLGRRRRRASHLLRTVHDHDRHRDASTCPIAAAARR